MVCDIPELQCHSHTVFRTTKTIVSGEMLVTPTQCLARVTDDNADLRQKIRLNKLHSV